MTRRTSIFVLVLSVFVVLLLTACGGSTDPIVGEWRATNPEMALKFFQDGTVTWKQGGRTFTGQYKQLDKENIRLDMVGDLGSRAIVLENIKISGDTLTLTLDGQQIAFSRSNGGSQASLPNTSTPQSTPNTSQTNIDSIDVLAGKWVVDPQGVDPNIYKIVVQGDGKIQFLIAYDNGDRGDLLDIQADGEGKFSGHVIHPSSTQAFEIQVSGDGQKLVMKVQNSEGKWDPSVTFVRFDETKLPKPTATPVVGPNLIPNSSFEEGATLPVGWVPRNKATSAHVWDTTQAHSGQHSLGAIGYAEWELSQPISVKPGRQYQVALWYRNTIRSESLADLTIFDESGIGAGVNVVGFRRTDGDWKYITGVFAPEPGKSKVRLVFSITPLGEMALDPTQGVWIDDVSFAEIQ